MSAPPPSAASTTSSDPLTFYSHAPKDSIAVLATAPVNIAVIKYWGKRDTKLILPVNSSLSATIDPSSMCSTTAVVASKSFTEDQLILNGQQEKWSSRLLAVLTQLRQRAEQSTTDDGRSISVSELQSYKVHIVSSNNFPTAAGLASSASGFACLTTALAALYNVKEQYEGELTIYARQGSGSACRSLYGGWVEWQMGSKADGSDSLAKQIVDEHYWPEIRVLIAVASAAKKETASTEGMQLTVQTSPFLQYRAEHIVPQRMQQMTDAIKQRNFAQFAELTMRDSNSFHSTCADTYPPIFYMNDTSKEVIKLIDAYNTSVGQLVAAYTFDAGPNAVIYTTDKHLSALTLLLQSYFQSPPLHNPTNIALDTNSSTSNTQLLQQLGQRPAHTALNQIIVTKPGRGSEVVKKQYT